MTYPDCPGQPLAATSPVYGCVEPRLATPPLRELSPARGETRYGDGRDGLAEQPPQAGEAT